MGSVCTDVVCPNCGNQEAFNDFDYKNGEEYTCCEKCGYTRTVEIIDRSLPLVEDNYYTREISKPYGAYHFKSGEHHHTWGTLETADDAIDFTLMVANANDVKEAYINRLIDGEIVKVILVSDKSIKSE